MYCVCHAFASVHCCPVVTCWERAVLLVSFVMFNCVLVTFPSGILGQVWYLIVTIPDLCRCLYFQLKINRENIQIANHICHKKKQILFSLSQNLTWSTYDIHDGSTWRPNMHLPLMLCVRIRLRMCNNCIFLWECLRSSFPFSVCHIV